MDRRGDVADEVGGMSHGSVLDGAWVVGVRYGENPCMEALKCYMWSAGSNRGLEVEWNLGMGDM